jgi:hypothetical protein
MQKEYHETVAYATKGFFDFAQTNEFALVCLDRHKKFSTEPGWTAGWSKDRADWEKWIAEGFNVGVHAGASRLITFDLDSKHGGIEAVRQRFDAWCASNGMAPLPHQTETPSAGQHVYMLVPGDVDPFALASNLSGKIGVGIDVLVGNRQSVAAGSYFDGTPEGKPSGTYSFNDAPLYEAPQTVLKFCTRAPASEQTTATEPFGYDFDDCKALYKWMADNSVIENDDDWYQSGAAAKLEFGDRGKELWEIIAQTLWNEPVDYKSLRRWESFRPRPNASTLKSFFDRAHKLGWKGTVRQSIVTMFGGVGQLVTAPSLVPTAPAFPMPPTADQVATLKANELPLIFFDEARNAPVQRYHIKGFIAEGETSSVFAHPKKMKSTIITDAGVHLAAGKADWRGRRIREAKGVVYFAFERHIQVRQALTAYAIRDGLENIPFVIVPRLINMLDPGCVEPIKNAIDRVQQRYGIEVALSVFDTWNKGIAAGGGSEDKAEHQNAAAANLRRLIEQLPGLHCLTIGHAGKDVSKGERGSNATEGDRGVGFEIKSDGGKHALEVAYANALPEGDVITTFEGELIEIGKDEDGEPVNSFIVSRLPVAMQTAKVKQTLKEPEQLVLDALRGVLKSKGQTGHAIGGRSVMRSEWLDECLRLGTVGQNPWRDIERRQQKLLAAGRIFVLDERVRLTSEAVNGAQSIPTPTLPSNGIPMPPGHKDQRPCAGPTIVPAL